MPTCIADWKKKVVAVFSLLSDRLDRSSAFLCISPRIEHTVCFPVEWSKRRRSSSCGSIKKVATAAMPSCNLMNFYR